MGVEFDENKPVNYDYKLKDGSLTSFFIRIGWAKDEKGAQTVMIVITIVCFSLSIYFFYKALH